MNEICEWKDSGMTSFPQSFYKTSCNENYMCEDISCTLPHEFSFCSYCGKKIKIIDREDK